MAGLGKHIPSAMAMARSNSRILVIVLPLLGLSFLLLLFSSPPLRTTPSPSHFHLPNTNIETSFVASLEHFLTHKAPPPNSPSLSDDTVLGAPSRNDITNLDNALYHNDMDRVHTDPYYPVSLPLRVYVYNMPSRFTYDLLWLFSNTYKDTSNLTSNGSPVHRLIEQHSIDYWLWADLIAPQSERLLKSVVRVHRQEDADLFYIPFFTTISFFLMEKQQCKALYRVKL